MWLAFLNDSGETIPPFAAVEPLGLDESSGLVLVGKPSGAAVNVWFNGGAAVSPDDSGQLTTTLPARAAYAADNDDGADPVHGEIWGVQADSWYLHRGDLGFQVVGSGSKGICNVIPQPFSRDATRKPWNYVGPKTANYTAAVGEAVLVNMDAGDFTITLPDWTTSVVNDAVAIVIKGYLTSSRRMLVKPGGSDKLNGLTGSWVMADTDGVAGTGMGGVWEFLRTPESDWGWECSRHLTT
jgi:hypothetical protein